MLRSVSGVIIRPYGKMALFIVGTGVLDCPFGRKCYIIPIRVAEDVDLYNAREAKRLPYEKEYHHV